MVLHQGLQVGLFLAGGLLLMLLGVMIWKEGPGRHLNRVTAAMLLFAGLGSLMGAIGTLLALPGPEGIDLIDPQASALPLEGLRQIGVLWEFFFPTLVLFSLVFPREHETLSRNPRLVWLLYLPYLLHLLLVLLYLNPGLVPRPDLTAAGGIIGSFLKLIGFVWLLIATLFDLLYQAHLQLWAAVNLCYVAAALYFLNRSRLDQGSRRLRQQLTIIQVGIGTSVGVYLVVRVLPILLPPLAPPDWLAAFLLPLALLAGCGTIAWVIVRHQFLDIQVLAKRSLIYSAATGAVIGLYLLLYSFLHDIFARLSGPEAAQGTLMVQILFVAVAVLTFQPMLGLLETLVDRFFIRDQSDYRHVLQQSVRNILGILDIDALVRAVYQTLERAFLVEEVAVVLLDRPTGTYRFVRRGPPPLRQGRWEIGTPRAYEGPEEDPDGADLQTRRTAPSGPGKVVFRTSDPLVEALLRAPGPVRYDRLLTELGEHPAHDRPPLAELRPKLVVPLRQRNELIGVMTIGAKLADTGFNPEEVMLLSLLGSQMSVAVENAWLHEERIEQERMREELAVARKIQQDLLPPRFPRGPGFDVSAINLPSREIGGDYFDFIVDPPDPAAEVERLMMVIADVSGKGTPAALLMASLQATLRAVYEVQPDLSAAAEKVNTVIHRTTDAEKFITLFMAVYEVGTRTLCYTNAGHNFPILTRGTGEQIRLEEGGLLLGVLEKTSYQQQRIQLESGDLLVMYTDGVTEALNEQGEEYGEERLALLLADRTWLGARELRDEIYRDVLAFAGSQPQVDDLTLVILKVL